MATLPNMGLETPTPGGDAGNWDDLINDDLEILDAHRHEAGNGLRIRPAGMDINADLTFNSLYAPIALHRITFASIVALTGNNKSLFVNTSDNELYWRSSTGTNVKLTAGNALNVAAFTGGFGAGYTSASAAADYDDSTEQYTFKQAAAGNWSRLGVGGIRLYEFGTSETLRVGLLAPAGLASSYDITMPLAAPASTQIMQMSSAGVVSMIGTNEHVTVTGTGRFKYQDDSMIISAPMFQSTATAGNYAAGTTPVCTNSGTWTFSPGAGIPIVAGFHLPIGCRIRAIEWHFNKGGSSASLTMALRERSGGVVGNIDAVVNVDSGVTEDTETRVGINYTIVANTPIWLEVTAGNAAHVFLYAEVIFDRP